MNLRRLYRKYFPTPLKRLLGQINPNRKLDFGDFERQYPISTQFGYDRGGPIDRIYIESFLQKNQHFIRGRVLEIGDNYYTLQFGGTNVEKSDVLHVHERNPLATIIGDLSTLEEPDNSFDCIILTQTLHLIYDFKTAMLNCRRMLKPGGTLLITVPGIVNIPHDEWGAISYYSFTSHFMRRATADIFPDDLKEIAHYGNVFTAAMFLYGVGAPEIRPSYFNIQDEHYQIIISALVQKKNIEETK